MACTGGCNKKKVVAPAPMPRGQQPRVMDGEVEVSENSGNFGMHFTIGRITRRNYGRHKHGDRFPMDVRDQQAQATLYVIVQAIPTQSAPAPSAPAPSVPTQSAVVQPVPMPVVPVPAMQEEQELPKDQLSDVVGKQTTSKLPDTYIEKQPEVDSGLGKPNTPTDWIPPVGTLSESMLRKMSVTPQAARDMLAEEIQGKNRKGIRAYLQELIDGELGVE